MTTIEENKECYYVIAQDQGNEMVVQYKFNHKEMAKRQRKELRKQYYDVVILTGTEYKRIIKNAKLFHEMF